MMKWCTLLALLVAWLVTGFCCFGEGRPWEGPGRAGPPAQRIVSLAPNLTEILFALGLDQQIAGVTDYSDFPPAARTKPKVGSFWIPSIEAIVARRPDLVVTLGFGGQRAIGRRLARVNIPSFALEIETVDQLLGGIGALGTRTGRRAEAARLQADMAERLERIAGANAGTAPVRVLWVIQRDPLRVAGLNSLTEELIERAGGVNAMGPTLHKYPPIGVEQAMASRPEVIIEQSMGGHDPARQLREARAFWGRFDRIPAVRQGRIYVVDGDTVSRLGPRICAGIESVARCLHPGDAEEGP